MAEATIPMAGTMSGKTTARAESCRAIRRGGERRVAEDDRGDDGDDVGLEEVGGHPRAVADVVAHVVGDGRRVAGSSSGMPASTLPTRSAPTSAALVKMPPPTLMNRAIRDAPNPKPTRTAVAVFWKSEDDHRGPEEPEADAEHPGDRTRSGRPP
jgi:hypothetical protein